MLMVENHLNFTHTQTFTNVGGGPSVWLVAPNLYSCVCLHVSLLAATCLPTPNVQRG